MGGVNGTEAEKRLHRCCFTGHRPEKLNCTEKEAVALLTDQITEEHQTREIDDMIRAHYDVDPNSGTFSLISFECPHHKHIMAEVFPAENRYTFWTRSK